MSFYSKTTKAAVFKIADARNSYFSDAALASHLRKLYEMSHADNAVRVLVLRDLLNCDSAEDVAACIARYPDTVWNRVFVGSDGNVWSLQSIKSTIEGYFNPDIRVGASPISDVEDVRIAGVTLSDIAFDLECLTDVQGLYADALTPIAEGVDDGLQSSMALVNARLSSLDTSKTIGSSVVNLFASSGNASDLLMTMLNGIRGMAESNLQQEPDSLFPKFQDPNGQFTGNWGIVAAFDSFNPVDVIVGVADTTEKIVDGVLGGLVGLVNNVLTGGAATVDETIQGRSVKRVSRKDAFQYPWVTGDVFSDEISSPDCIASPGMAIPTLFKDSTDGKSLGAALYEAHLRGKTHSLPPDWATSITSHDPNVNVDDIAVVNLQSDTNTVRRIFSYAFSVSEARSMHTEYNSGTPGNFSVVLSPDTFPQGQQDGSMRPHREFYSSRVSEEAFYDAIKLMYMGDDVYNVVYKRAVDVNNSQPSTQLWFSTDYAQRQCSSVTIAIGIPSIEVAGNLALRSSDGSLKIALRHGKACSIAKASTHLAVAYLRKFDIDEIARHGYKDGCVVFMQFCSSGDLQAWVVAPGPDATSPVLSCELRTSSTLSGVAHVFEKISKGKDYPADCSVDSDSERMSLKMYITSPFNNPDAAAELKFGIAKRIQIYLNTQRIMPGSWEINRIRGGIIPTEESTTAYRCIKYIKYALIDLPKTKYLEGAGDAYSYYTWADDLPIATSSKLIELDKYDSEVRNNRAYTVQGLYDSDRFFESPIATPRLSQTKGWVNAPNNDWAITSSFAYGRIDYVNFIMHQLLLEFSVLPVTSAREQIAIDNLIANHNAQFDYPDTYGVLVACGLSGLFSIVGGQLVDAHHDSIDQNAFNRLATHSNAEVAKSVCVRSGSMKRLAIYDSVSTLNSWLIAEGYFSNRELETLKLEASDDRTSAAILNWLDLAKLVSFPVTLGADGTFGYTITTDEENADAAFGTLATVAIVIAAAYIGGRVLASRKEAKACYNAMMSKPVTEISGSDLSQIVKKNSKRSKVKSLLSKYAVGLIPTGYSRDNEEFTLSDMNNVKGKLKDLDDVLGGFLLNEWPKLREKVLDLEKTIGKFT